MAQLGLVVDARLKQAMCRTIFHKESDQAMTSIIEDSGHLIGEIRKNAGVLPRNATDGASVPTGRALISS